MIAKYDYQEQVVWIVGASTGIGNALAHELAARGGKLALSARSKDKLEQLRLQLGECHHIFPLDVTDASSCIHVTQEILSAFGRIDRVIFLAAAYKPMKLDALDLDETKQIIEVNLMGALNFLHAVVPALKSQGHGQIALCGSVAGYTGLPDGQPYSATKAGIINVAESLRAELPASIDVKLISPGFVKTPLTDKNDFEMPMMITPEKAAMAIADGMKSSGFEIHFPKGFTILLKIIRALPYCLKFFVTRKFVTKQ